MRIVKLAIISAVVLFGLLTVISSLLPSHIRISRATDINVNAGTVYAVVVNIHQWKDWNEYIRSFKNVRNSHAGIISDEMSVTLTQLSDSLLLSEWKPSKGRIFGSGFAILPHDNQHCTVQWYFDFKIRWYPWEKFQSIVYDQQMGPPMEKSLSNLKDIVEKSH
jgi:hypothetical protein